MFVYIKLFLAIMFGWLLYVTLVQIVSSTYTLLRDRSLTFEDAELGEVVLVMGKDTKKITIFLLQHYLITTIFAIALILTLT